MLEYSTWDGLREISRTPWLMVYDDGLAIVRRYDHNQPWILPTYWFSRLNATEVSELSVLQVNALRDPQFSAYYRLRNATDLPTTAFYFGSSGNGIASVAYGLWRDSDGTPNESAYDLPATMARYYEFMSRVAHSSQDWEPWVPDRYVAFLRPEPGNEKGESWPRDWPGLKSCRPVPGSAAVEIVVPVQSWDHFWDSFGGSPVFLDGRNWRVDCYPRLPRQELWSDAVAATQANIRPNDMWGP